MSETDPFVSPSAKNLDERPRHLRYAQQNFEQGWHLHVDPQGSAFRHGSDALRSPQRVPFERAREIARTFGEAYPGAIFYALRKDSSIDESAVGNPPTADAPAPAKAQRPAQRPARRPKKPSSQQQPPAPPTQAPARTEEPTMPKHKTLAAPIQLTEPTYTAPQLCEIFGVDDARTFSPLYRWTDSEKTEEGRVYRTNARLVEALRERYDLQAELALPAKGGPSTLVQPAPDASGDGQAEDLDGWSDWSEPPAGTLAIIAERGGTSVDGARELVKRPGAAEDLRNPQPGAEGIDLATGEHAPSEAALAVIAAEVEAELVEGASDEPPSSTAGIFDGIEEEVEAELAEAEAELAEARELLAALQPIGARVTTPDGAGVVTDQPYEETLEVDVDGATGLYRASDVQPAPKAEDLEPAPAEPAAFVPAPEVTPIEPVPDDEPGQAELEIEMLAARVETPAPNVELFGFDRLAAENRILEVLHPSVGFGLDEIAAEAGVELELCWRTLDHLHREGRVTVEVSDEHEDWYLRVGARPVTAAAPSSDLDLDRARDIADRIAAEPPTRHRVHMIEVERPRELGRLAGDYVLALIDGDQVDIERARRAFRSECIRYRHAAGVLRGQAAVIESDLDRAERLVQAAEESRRPRRRFLGLF